MLMFIFKPGNIDPVTMPVTVALLQQRADVGSIVWLMEVGAGQMLTPSCILMSLRSVARLLQVEQ